MNMYMVLYDDATQDIVVWKR